MATKARGKQTRQIKRRHFVIQNWGTWHLGWEDFTCMWKTGCPGNIVLLTVEFGLVSWHFRTDCLNVIWLQNNSYWLLTRRPGRHKLNFTPNFKVFQSRAKLLPGQFEPRRKQKRGCGRTFGEGERIRARFHSPTSKAAKCCLLWLRRVDVRRQERKVWRVRFPGFNFLWRVTYDRLFSVFGKKCWDG